MPTNTDVPAIVVPLVITLVATPGPNTLYLAAAGLNQGARTAAYAARYSNSLCAASATEHVFGLEKFLHTFCYAEFMFCYFKAYARSLWPFRASALTGYGEFKEP